MQKERKKQVKESFMQADTNLEIAFGIPTEERVRRSEYI